MTDNTRGAFLMMASMLAFTVNDACIKATDGALPFFQLLFLRGVLSTFLIALALVAGTLAIAGATGGSQVNHPALTVGNYGHNVFSNRAF